MSIDDLTRPVEVLAEVSRVLRPGAPGGFGEPEVSLRTAPVSSGDPLWAVVARAER